MLKITLVKPISDSPKFLELLEKYSVTAERIFPSNDKKFRVVGEFNETVKKEFHDCVDIFDCIIQEKQDHEYEPI